MTACLRIGTFLAVLTFAPMQAWAECAWVLWQEQTVTGSTGVIQATRWSPIGGSSGIGPCGKALPPDSREPRADATPGELVKQYRCLPDTIDPRGPKGGGR
jgi:hypothetical protein